jgi:hypothetical protein
MKKLSLDTLRVETFATTSATLSAHGTVLGQEMVAKSLAGCPVSYGGTCYITCAETCPCTDSPRCA